MWDSGIGVCVGCGKTADRDVLGRCPACFQASVTVPQVYFKEMGVENPMDPKGSTAHVKDIKARRLDVKSGQMFYAEPQRTYFFSRF